MVYNFFGIRKYRLIWGYVVCWYFKMFYNVFIVLWLNIDRDRDRGIDIERDRDISKERKIEWDRYRGRCIYIFLKKFIVFYNCLILNLIMK